MSLICLRKSFAEPQNTFHILRVFTFDLDASFIGSVDKDQKAVVAEHHEIFVEANKKILKKRVHCWECIFMPNVIYRRKIGCGARIR